MCWCPVGGRERCCSVRGRLTRVQRRGINNNSVVPYTIHRGGVAVCRGTSRVIITRYIPLLEGLFEGTVFPNGFHGRRFYFYLRPLIHSLTKHGRCCRSPAPQWARGRRRNRPPRAAAAAAAWRSTVVKSSNLVGPHGLTAASHWALRGSPRVRGAARGPRSQIPEVRAMGCGTTRTVLSATPRGHVPTLLSARDQHAY